MKTSSYLFSMSLIFISIITGINPINASSTMPILTVGPDGKYAGGTFDGKYAGGTFGKYFDGLTKIKDCTGSFVVTSFDPISKIPTCKTQSAFIKEYFGTQSGIVPSGNVVTGFDPITGKMQSNSANTMIAGVFIGMSDGGNMEALIGYDITGPVYSRNIGYWLDNGGAGIRYVGSVKVGGFLGGEMTANSVGSPTDAIASNHLVRKGQFLSLMKTTCENDIKGTWDGTNCIPKNCNVAPFGIVAHGSSVTAYKESTRDSGYCTSQVRFCDNGKLSGNYTSTYCGVRTYSWETTGFGTCNATCGGGKAYQTVWCQRDDGITVDDSYCSGASKPSTSTDCNTQACEIGPTCDDGIKNQGETKVDCGGPNCDACSVTPPVCIPNGSCTAAAPGCDQTTTGIDNCGNSCEKTGPSCGSGGGGSTTGSYTYGNWGTCTGACGTNNGTQTRSESCNFDICTNQQATERACTASACAPVGTTGSYTYGNWGTCTGACGTNNGTQTRSESCSFDVCTNQQATERACTASVCPPVCTPYACNAPEPACGQTTSGTQDSCGTPCEKTGVACPTTECIPGEKSTPRYDPSSGEFRQCTCRPNGTWPIGGKCPIM